MGVGGDPSKSSSSGGNNNKKKKSKDEQKINKKHKSNNMDHLDLCKPLFPLGHFLDDPSQLVEEIFRTLDAVEIQRMLPNILKGCSLTELKKLCLDEAQKMPKKLMEAILEGKVSNYTDEDFTSSIWQESQQQQQPEQSEQMNVNASPCSLQMADSTSDLLEDDRPKDENNKQQQVDRKQKPGRGNSPTSESEMLELHVDTTDVDSLITENSEEESRQVQGSASSPGNAPTSSILETAVTESLFPPCSLSSAQMELLELELRARAIKTLLRTHGTTVDD